MASIAASELLGEVSCGVDRRKKPPSSLFHRVEQVRNEIHGPNANVPG